MRLNDKKAALGLALAAGLAIVPLLAPAARPVLLMAISVSMCALGLLLLLRAGQVSFGHALYFAAGAYTVAFGARLLTTELLVLLPLAVLVSFLLGAALGAILVRYRDIFYAMLNLAFSMLGFTLLLRLYALTGGSDGLAVPPPTLFGWTPAPIAWGWVLYYASLLLLGLVLLLVTRYLAAPPGQALQALKTNETRLEYLGISGRQVLFTGHVTAAVLAGLGGAIAALSTGHVTPEMAYWSRSAEFVFIAVLGGVGNVLGAVVGAVSFELIRTAASAIAADIWQLVTGIVLVVIVLFAPGGLWGLAQRWLQRRGEEETVR